MWCRLCILHTCDWNKISFFFSSCEPDFTPIYGKARLFLCASTPSEILVFENVVHRVNRSSYDFLQYSYYNMLHRIRRRALYICNLELSICATIPNFRAIISLLFPFKSKLFFNFSIKILYLKELRISNWKLTREFGVKDKLSIVIPHCLVCQLSSRDGQIRTY